MATQNFVDYVKINCRTGAGGQGSAHLHRDKMTAKGGPDGGDGGRGGHIILRGNEQMWTLLPLKYRKHVIAGNGENGSGSRSSGKEGEDVVLDVPLGTIAKNAETGEFLFEITAHDEEVILLSGGRGGRGNFHFKTSTNQTPRYAQPGEPGQEEWKILELKLLADIGLVGFPNAGKSTLLASITAAKPEIANYPFTTLKPNLGIVKYRDQRSFIMADIPGIIEKASEGKGLGLRFLRHIERNSGLLFVIPADSENIFKAYRILLRELEIFNPELLDKPRFVVISKRDIIDDEIEGWIREELSRVDFPAYMFISAVTGTGLDEMKDKLWDLLNG